MGEKVGAVLFGGQGHRRAGRTRTLPRAARRFQGPAVRHGGPAARCRATPVASCSRASCANRCSGATRCDETLLIANRGEIALRIIRTATELGMQTVAVYAEDDADSPHVHAADEAIGLPGAGPDAYLDQSAMLAAAKTSGTEMIHPGYGFLCENAEFARACTAAGYTFVGPDADALERVGNKSSARAAADGRRCAGTARRPKGPSSVEDIRAFFADHDGAIMIKALAGGGGRGMRKVEQRRSDRRRLPPVRRGGATGLRQCGVVRRGVTRRRAAHRGADRRGAGRASNACAGPR